MILVLEEVLNMGPTFGQSPRWLSSALCRLNRVRGAYPKEFSIKMTTWKFTIVAGYLFQQN